MTTISDGFRHPLTAGNPSAAFDGDGYGVMSAFGALQSGLRHLGEDWRGDGVGNIAGDPIYSPSNGKVVAKGDAPGTTGWYILIQHDLPKPITYDGITTSVVYTFYARLGTLDMVDVGDVVSKGEQISFVGVYSGETPHLHFEVRLGEGLLSPISSIAPSIPTGWVSAGDFVAEFPAIVLQALTEGDDVYIGTSDDDDLDALGGDDFVRGHAGADTIQGGPGLDTLIGDDGDDIIYGGDNDDNLFGKDGRDTLFGNGGNDKLFGGGDNDRLFGGNGNDSLYGNSNADIQNGENGADAFRGYGGNDRLNGGIGDDSLLGHTGNDIINGDEGSDILDAGEGNDQLFGGDDADTLFGRDGNDVIEGGGGDDLLFGNLGLDTLTGGLGNDTVTGHGGNDLFNFALGDGNDTINTFTEGLGVRDVISLSGFGTAFDTFAEVFAAATDDGFGNTVIDFGGGDSITLLGDLAADLNADDFVFV